MVEQEQLPMGTNENISEGNSEALVPANDMNELTEMSSANMVKRLENRMDFLNQTRTILLKKLNNPALWINYSGAFRLSKAAVNRIMTPLGICSQIIRQGDEIVKEDGTRDYKSIVRLSLAEFPDFFVERSGIVNSTEIFYTSQIDSDQKYEGKKFGKDSSVEKNLSHNCRQHSVQRAMTNAVSAMFGLDGITEDELKKAGIDAGKILSPYARSKTNKGK